MKEKMYKNLKRLKKEFFVIQCRNWVASRAEGSGAVGLTLEKLLGKENDTIALPDYLGIELKTKLITSYPQISLFSMALDSKPLLMQHVWEKYGWKSGTDKKFKVFYATIYGHRYMKTKSRYCYKLIVDRKANVVRLGVWDKHTKILDDSMSWSFQELNRRLNAKLMYLSVVHAQKNIAKGKEFFKYLDISFYKLRNFDMFLYLIEKGEIFVSITLSYFKKGPQTGKMNDKGSCFIINEKSLTLLFEKIDVDISTCENEEVEETIKI